MTPAELLSVTTEKDWEALRWWTLASLECYSVFIT